MLPQRDVWPGFEDRHVWLYEPCPPKRTPLVGPNHLMHLWEYPHHADQASFNEWKSHTSPYRRVVEKLRLLPTLGNQTQPAKTPKDAQNTIGKAEEQAHSHRSAYVFVKIPKKKGERLGYDFGDSQPEGYGIFFEEKFKVHRLLFAILIAYFLGSVAFIIWVGKTFPSHLTPQTWPGFFSVLAWVTSFLSLFVTVWFKWADT